MNRDATAQYRALLAQRDQLDQQITEKRRELVADAVDVCQGLIKEWGLTADDLGLVATQRLKPGPTGAKTFAVKKARAVRPPMYRDPGTGSTWNGNGRQPAWLEGHRDEYLIKDNEK